MTFEKTLLGSITVSAADISLSSGIIMHKFTYKGQNKRYPDSKLRNATFVFISERTYDLKH